MSRFFITGDIHREDGRYRLSRKNFPEGVKLTSKDYMCVAGDFGEVWYGTDADNKGINYHGTKKYTTLFIDGNHENFDVLDALPLHQWGQGFVHKIYPTSEEKNFHPPIHLLRGMIYEINGKTFFTFGGGNSIDKRDRLLYEKRTAIKSWWDQEMPSQEEYDRGIEILVAHNWTVDYVITHTCPTQYIYQLVYNLYKTDVEGNELSNYLSMIYDKINFKFWFFGHMHRDIILPTPRGKLVALYNHIYEVCDEGIKMYYIPRRMGAGGVYNV